MLRLIYLLIPVMLGLSFAPGHAAESPWSLSEGARMRIATLAPQQGGVVQAVLQIDLKPGWKTYWREPGASGVAPQLDFSASGNLVLEKVSFPVPNAIGEGQSSFNGYDQPVGLRLDFRQPQPGIPSVLRGSVLVGVCDKVCIPFTASYEIAIDPAGKVSADAFGAVKIADTFLPGKPDRDFSVVSSSLNEAEDGMTVELALPGKINPEIFVAAPPGFVIGKPATISFKGQNLVISLPVLRSPKGQTLRGKESLLLVKSGKRSMETALVPQ